MNFDLNAAGEHRKLQLPKLEELRFQAYKNFKLYNKKLLKMEFQPGKKVLLFTSLRLFLGKLKSKWSGPFIITKVMPHRVVILEDPATKRTWTMNGSKIKHYLGGDVERLTTVIQLQEA